MTQLELSEKVPCESSTLAHYETGKNLVSMTKLIRIADVLGVELYQFFISNTQDVDNSKLDSINELLSKANNIQLNLIYQIIESILELTPIE